MRCSQVTQRAERRGESRWVNMGREFRVTQTQWPGGEAGEK